MKKLIISLGLIFAIVVTFTKCKKDTTNSIQMVSKSEETRVLPLIKSINAPFNFENSIIIGDYILVENCYRFLNEKSLTERQSILGRIVALERVSNITVRIDASIPSSGEDNWRPAIIAAINNWNNIGQSLLKFNLVQNTVADIVIKSDNGFLPSTWQAEAKFPNQKPDYSFDLCGPGAPGFEVIINFDANNNEILSQSQMTYVMTHEFGHTLGFRHTDWEVKGEKAGAEGANLINGTSNNDINSIMRGSGFNGVTPPWASFSQDDIAATRLIYSRKRIIGTGWNSEGSDIAVGNIGGGSGQDVLLMSYDASSGQNTFRYRIGFDIDSDGNPTSVTPNSVIVAGVGDIGNGAGVALGNIGGSSTIDLVLFADDDIPNGLNQLRYRIGYDLNPTSGQPASVSNIITVPNGGMSWNSEGAGAALGNFDSDPRPDLVLMTIDNGSGANDIRYKIGYNLNSSGIATSWTGTIIVGGFSWENAGGGVAVGNLGGGAQPDILFMGYDKVENGSNEFRYKIGYDVSPTNGTVSSWSATTNVLGLTWLSAGAGIALGNLNGNSTPELFFMAEDNPLIAPNGTGMNELRYMVGMDINSQGVPVTLRR